MPVLSITEINPPLEALVPLRMLEPGHLNHILHRRLAISSLRAVGHHRFGTLQRRRLRQLHAGKQVTPDLPAAGKAFRHRGEAERHQRACRHRRRQRYSQGGGSSSLPAAIIDVAGAVEKTVKRSATPPPAGRDAAQQQRAEGWRRG